MFDKQQPIAIASDHAGYALKEYLKKELRERGYVLEDFGTDVEESMDYPDTVHPLARAVDEGRYAFAFIMCGSGIGVSMVANKYPGVRAALCWDEEQTELTRRHNDANVLSFPGRYIDFARALKMAEIFLNTDFEGGRHERRVMKIAPST
ncbi:MAG TPA: ribose 5-phosphate isomerase B [Bacteroidales bacterium]|nr:ribose 5-phosphate isomerase B [Bacteroidales bacterium]HRZ77005.1 ribose 5-phosphate isomerase B [Bacteroidales bacterium]